MKANRKPLSKHGWLQKTHFKEIPSWNLDQCLTFLSFSECTQIKQLPGAGTATESKEVVHQRLMQLISDCDNISVPQEMMTHDKDEIDYNAVVYVLNVLQCLIDKAFPIFKLPQIIISPNDSRDKLQRDIDNLHETAFLLMQIISRHNKSAPNDNNQSGITTVVKETDKLPSITATSDPIRVEPTIPIVPVETRQDPIDSARVSGPWISRLLYSEIDRWDLNTCVKFFMLSETTQKRLRGAPEPPKPCSVKDLVRQRLQFLISEKSKSADKSKKIPDQVTGTVHMSITGTLNVMLMIIRHAFSNYPKLILPMLPFTTVSKLNQDITTLQQKLFDLASWVNSLSI